MEITNGEVNVDLPESLAKLLLSKKSWAEGATELDTNEPQSDNDSDPIPMSHIPGVVPGVSMREIKRWVADGSVPHVLQGRTKLVKPSDARRRNESAG